MKKLSPLGSSSNNNKFLLSIISQMKNSILWENVQQQLNSEIILCILEKKRKLEKIIFGWNEIEIKIKKNFLLNHQENIFKLKRCEIAKKKKSKKISKIFFFVWASSSLRKKECERKKILRGLKIVTVKKLKNLLKWWKMC